MCRLARQHDDADWSWSSFFTALDIANADAKGSGEFCLRYDMPHGGLYGDSTPPDGSNHGPFALFAIYKEVENMALYVVAKI